MRSGRSPCVGFATDGEQGAFTADDALGAAALERRGVPVRSVVWSQPLDPEVEVVLLRSTWDYHLRQPPPETAGFTTASAHPAWSSTARRVSGGGGEAGGLRRRLADVADRGGAGGRSALRRAAGDGRLPGAAVRAGDPGPRRVVADL